MVFVGYHGTDKSNSDRILAEGFRLSSSENWLGEGVYFFEDLTPFSQGQKEAEDWAKYIKKFKAYGIIKSEIETDHCFDIFSNSDHKKKYFELRNTLFQKHQSSGSREEFKDGYVFNLIGQKLKVDAIRALVDGGKAPGYFTYVVKRLQIQLCVKKLDCIKSSTCVKDGLT